MGSEPITRSFTAARNTAVARGPAGGGPVDRSDLDELDARRASGWGQPVWPKGIQVFLIIDLMD